MMEILSSLLQALFTDVTAKTAVSMYHWVVRYMTGKCDGQPEAVVLKLLNDLGCLGENDIRRQVSAFARRAKLADGQAEELTALLINLARGAHFHTTQGTPRSSFLRCARLLERLLSHLQPVRKWGEPVADGLAHWKLVKFLGMGTFGEVWLARNDYHPEPRAFKFFTQEDGHRWIQQEQAGLYELQKKLPNHPNIVAFKDVALDVKPHPYLALEYIGGGSLEDWILSHEDDRRPLDKLELVQGMVRGLSMAHSLGIYHRDLKPANLLLEVEENGARVKIADFGLAKIQPATPGESAQTSQAVVVGTNIYLPPESLEPFRQREAAQDDVFAVGVVWYQLLVERLERPPYDFAEQLREKEVDSHTIRLIERCLAQPGRRFKDACVLVEAIDDGSLAPTDWEIPAGCYDVSLLAREYLGTLAR